MTRVRSLVSWLVLPRRESATGVHIEAQYQGGRQPREQHRRPFPRNSLTIRYKRVQQQQRERVGQVIFCDGKGTKRKHNSNLMG